MFGNNGGFGAFGAQNTQQQGTSAFGQPAGNNAFGAAGTFGSAGAFGQPQQQPQQPAANPMFGGFGANTANANPTGTGGFGSTGAFGQNNNTGAGAFGAPKPATFGAFGGGTSTFGGGGAFGTTPAQPAATGAFGQPSTSTGAFGAGGGLFGAKPATGFGATATTADGNPAPVTTGSSNPPYQAFSEKDSANASVTLQYQSISCMPAYRGTSFEELRVQDYAQNRKTASAGAGAFGASTFGQPATGTGLFGAAQPQQQNTGFGAFGATANPNPAGTAFGAFGQTNQPQQPQAGTGLFGGGGAFGQTNQQQQQQQPATTGFGAFGQQNANTAAPSTGLFGGGGAFGQNNANQAKPFGGFGAGTTASTGLFGQNTQQQGTTGTGLFGQQQPQQNTTGAFGGFGANNNQPKPSIFGTPANTTQPATGGFGTFGQPQNQQQPGQQPAGGLFGGGTTGGLFGQNNQQQQPAQQQQGGLFGSTQPAQQPTTGLFGGGGTTGGLFGQNTQQNQQQPAQTNAFGGGGLFGAKPAAAPSTGLFGQPTNNAAPAQPAGGMFGNNAFGQTNNQQPAAGTGMFGGGGGIFGAKPAAPAFGATQSTMQQGAGPSLFGNSFGGSTNMFGATAMGQGTQGTLTASIAQPIGANLPIFNMLPPGPRAVTLDQPKKKAGFFADVPTRAPVPRLQLGYTPANAKLRGFASTTGGPGASLLVSTNRMEGLSLSRSTSPTKGPEVFLNGGGSGGNNGRQSVKKLILSKKVEPHLLGRSGSPGLNGKPTFSPALGVAARKQEAEAALHGTPAKPPSPKLAPSRFAATPAADGASDSGEPQDGDYWSQPSLPELRKLGYHELRAFKGLIVGRVGYGQVEFLEPVDLTGIPKFDDLLGNLVTFEDKECAVYPNSDDADKPPPGEGLNVPARITLVKCWALDKASRQPIKDENHPAAIKHQRRLEKIKNTTFKSFDIKTGKWVFEVEGF